MALGRYSSFFNWCNDWGFIKHHYYTKNATQEIVVFRRKTIWPLALIMIFCLLVIPDPFRSALLTIISILIATGSFLFAGKSFKQTDETLKMTKRDQEIQKLESSLNKFYYPLREYLSDEYMAGQMVDCRQPLEWRRIEFNRFLATEKTRKQIELARKETYSHIGAETIKLAGFVKTDIENIERELQNKRAEQ